MCAFPARSNLILMDGSAAAPAGFMKEQPSRTILDDYRHSGISWLAVNQNLVSRIIKTLVLQGEPFDEDFALLDLHYWINAQQVRPYRYYATRWQWSPDRVRCLFERLGIMKARQRKGKSEGGEQPGSNRVTQVRRNGTQNAAKSGKKTTRAPQMDASAPHLPLLIDKKEEERKDMHSPHEEKPKKKRARKSPASSDPVNARNLTPDEVFAALTFPPGYDTPALLDAFRGWITHRLVDVVRANPRSKLKTPPIKFFTIVLDRYTSEASAKRLSPAGLVAAIEHSIFKQWEGLFPDPDFVEPAELSPDGTTTTFSYQNSGVL